MKYTLQDFTNIMFEGFKCTLPEETIQIISSLAQEVGSPTYIKTPVFDKREPASSTAVNKKRKGNKGMEVLGEEDWSSIRSFQPTVIEQKVGIDAQFDKIRLVLNKISDANYVEQKNNICDIMDELIANGILEEDMTRVGNAIFVIASNNRFYSKLYADLYTDLINQYPIMLTIFENNFSSFITVFNTISYVDAEVNYDLFCKNNKDNEARKSLSMFFVNLMKNGIIAEDRIITITHNLVTQVMEFIVQDNKKNEVDELSENIALLHNKKILGTSVSTVANQYIVNNINMLSKSKVKTYKSLSNKAIFKFMDIVEK